MAKALASTVAQIKREIAARNFDRADRLLRQALSSDPDAPELHEQRGLLAYGKGDVPGALDALKAAVALAPSDREIRFNQLRVAANSEFRDLAGDIAVEAVAAAPDDDRMLRMAARALMRKRDYALAGAYWRRLGERTGDIAALVEGARVLVAARDYAEALDCAEEALRRDPVSEAAKIQRVRALERLAPDSAALGQAVIDVAATNAWEALEYLPYLLCYDLNDSLADLVIACGREDIRIDPVLVPPVRRAIEAAARRADEEKRPDDAARCWLAIRLLDDDGTGPSEDLVRTIGLLLAEVRTGAEASLPDLAERLKSLLGVDRAHRDAWKDLAEALEARRAWNEAAHAWLGHAAVLPKAAREPDLRKAAAAADKVASAEQRLALFGETSGFGSGLTAVAEGLREATRTVARAATADMDSGRLREAAARVVLIRRWTNEADGLGVADRMLSLLRGAMRDADKDGRAREAAEAAQLQVDIDPDCVPALRHLARDAMRDHRSDDAVRLYVRLLKINPGVEEYFVKLGQAYRRLGRYDEGVAIIRRLLELDPDHALGRDLLARMLQASQTRALAATD